MDDHGYENTDQTITRLIWERHVARQVAAGMCPYSGLPGPECKSWLCDCFEFPQWEAKRVNDPL